MLCGNGAFSYWMSCKLYIFGYLVSAQHSLIRQISNIYLFVYFSKLCYSCTWEWRKYYINYFVDILRDLAPDWMCAREKVLLTQLINFPADEIYINQAQITVNNTIKWAKWCVHYFLSLDIRQFIWHGMPCGAPNTHTHTLRGHWTFWAYGNVCTSSTHICAVALSAITIIIQCVYK